MSNSRYIIRTADDEEPKCENCDHVCDAYVYCETNCGAEHFWKGYQRTERQEEPERKKRRPIRTDSVWYEMFG